MGIGDCGLGIGPNPHLISSLFLIKKFLIFENLG
jgi:hypothetical protein